MSGDQPTLSTDDLSPGPWIINWDGVHSTIPSLHYVNIRSIGYEDVAPEGLSIAAYVRKPDAYALGAAWDLLGALRDARIYLPGRPGCPPSLLECVDAAIAKAEGRS